MHLAHHIQQLKCVALNVLRFLAYTMERLVLLSLKERLLRNSDFQIVVCSPATGKHELKFRSKQRTVRNVCVLMSFILSALTKKTDGDEVKF